MRVLSIWGFFLLFCFNGVLADEVYLKNGKAWINVKVLKEKSDQVTVVLFTSLGKKVKLKRSEIAGIKESIFEPRKESKLVEVGKEYVEYLTEKLQEPAPEKMLLPVSEKQLKKLCWTAC